MKIVIIIGARPQFIKASAVSRAIADHNSVSKNQITEVLVHTGQHFDKNMSGIFFEEMNIPKPDYNLDINSLSHGAMTGRMLEEIEKILIKEKPDWVLVFGDTNSTIAGALAARKLHIKLAHVEAGTRSFNTYMPEEINRILTDRISSALFCPTETAMKNLKKEGYPNQQTANGQQLITNVGDVTYDSAMFYSDLCKRPPFMDQFYKASLEGESFILVTAHRPENTDDLKSITDIFDALNIMSEKNKIILPLHPRTRKIIAKHKFKLSKNIFVCDPLGYLEMLWLLKKCKLVVTDSGGLQKDAYFFGKPCVTLREDTEWPELIDAGVNCLVGSDKKKILEAVTIGLDKKIDLSPKYYGNADAAQKIIECLIREK